MQITQHERQEQTNILATIFMSYKRAFTAHGVNAQLGRLLIKCTDSIPVQTPVDHRHFCSSVLHCCSAICGISQITKIPHMVK